MADIIQLRGDTAANWSSVNPILADREFGYETDTKQFKVGDGILGWNALPYGGVSGPTGGFSYETLSATGTVSPTEIRHTAYITGDDSTITLPDATIDNNQITIFNLTDDDITIVGTGLSGDALEIATLFAVTYTWYDSEWKVLASGGSGFVPSYEVLTSSGTAVPEEVQHTVYATVADIVVTLPDGIETDERITVYNTSSGEITTSGTTISDTIKSGYSIEYAWQDSQWKAIKNNNPFGGVQLPQPKTFIEKWNDGGAGTVTSKVNEWGIGKYLINVASTVLSKDNQTVMLNIENLTEDFYAQYIGSAVTTGNFKYDYVANAFTYVSSVVYINSISRFEDDPDNLPLYEIPADPGLIKDWYEVWTGTHVGTGNTNIGSLAKGRYKASGLFGTATASWYFDWDPTDTGTTRSTVGGQSASDYISYDGTNLSGGHASVTVSEIERWQDVAGSDAQLNPPVEGWEDLYNDPTNTTQAIVVPAPDGKYQLTVKKNATTETYTCLIQVDNTKLSCTGVWHDSGGRAFYTPASNTWDSGNVAYAIIKIEEWDALVNVYHSWKDIDPRAIAQKDYVLVWDHDEDNGGVEASSVYNNWGIGKYAFVGTYTYGGTRSGSAFLVLDNLTQDHNILGGAGGAGTDYYWGFDASAMSFTAPSGGNPFTIRQIWKWQDSMATDAARTVLDDGFETVYEDDTHTGATLTQLVENGTYVITMTSSTISYTSILTVDNSKTQCDTSWTGTGVLYYTTATGLWNNANASYPITLIRKMTGKTVIDIQSLSVSLSDGPNQVIDLTPTADTAVTLPTSPDLGDIYEVWNNASAGTYYIDITTDGSTLFNSLRIGGGKGLKLRYTGVTWRYEDVSIDEYSVVATITNTNGVSTAYVKKWAGGKMEIRYKVVSDGNTAYKTITHPETWVGDYETTGGIGGNGSNAGRSVINRIDIDLWDVIILITDSGTASGSDFRVTYEGRWKAGV